MFKLGLNMSSTRSILTTGNGGHVIEAFADVVAGENYIVGIILFVIIMIVQLVVVTNGSGRVSEVSARFTLDAMPGKQMAIDSDLNSGAITEEQARQIVARICSAKLISTDRWMVLQSSLKVMRSPESSSCWSI